MEFYEIYRFVKTKKIHQITKIDYWFLHQIEELVVLEKEIEKYTIDTIPVDMLLEAKMKGYADRQIAHLLGCLESEIFNKRMELNIKRNYKSNYMRRIELRSDTFTKPTDEMLAYIRYIYSSYLIQQFFNFVFVIIFKVLFKNPKDIKNRNFPRKL